jgi:hypothetical protein
LLATPRGNAACASRPSCNTQRVHTTKATCCENSFPGTGSSTQALVTVTGTRPARMKGRRRQESTAQERGASQQSQVHHNSCANEARRSSTPKHPTALSTMNLLVRRRPQDNRAREQIISVSTMEASFESIMAASPCNRSQLQPSQGARSHTLAGHSHAWPAGATPWPAAASPREPRPQHGRPWPTRGHEPAASATRGVRLDALKTAQNHAQCNGRTLVSQQPRHTSSPQYT